MIRTVTALRQGAGRDYLVYGRMMRPAQVDQIDIIEWEYQGRWQAIPAVFHSAWQNPQGRFALTLANWTDDQQLVRIQDLRLSRQIRQILSGREISQTTQEIIGGQMTIELPPLSIVLIENTSA